MAVWDVTSRRRVRKLAGHSSAGAGARCLAFSPSGDCAVSAAAGDRAVAVWDIAAASSAAASKSSSPAAAVGRVALPDGIPLQLSTSASAGDDGAFDLCAVSEDGVAFFWCCAPGGLPQSDARRLQIGAAAQANALNRECILAVVVEAALAAGACRPRPRHQACGPVCTVLFSATDSGASHTERPPVTQCHSDA